MDECIHNFDIVICSINLKLAVDFFIFCCVQSNKILYIHNHNLQYIPDKDISVIGLAHWPSFLKVNSLHRLLILLSLILFVFIFTFLRLLSRKIMSKKLKASYNTFLTLSEKILVIRRGELPVLKQLFCVHNPIANIG